MKGTPLPLDHKLGDGSDDSDSDLSDGSMTEVTVEVMSPLSDDEEDEEHDLVNTDGEYSLIVIIIICIVNEVVR